MLYEKYHLYINKDDIFHVVHTCSIPGKPHLAKLMLKYNYVENVEEAFNRYLKTLNPSTLNTIDAKRVIDTIHKAGGIAILAHPKKYENQYHIDFSIIVDQLRQLGIDGIEIYNSLHHYTDTIRYNDYATLHHLITTGGSDYHGIIVKPHVKLGMLYNDYKEHHIKHISLNYND